MQNLYIFAIGGSGERVMNSLVMMLAAGMPAGAQRITPVFVDNDVNSNALKKSLRLIEYYRANETGKMGLHELGRNVPKSSNKSKGAGTEGVNQEVPSFAHVELCKPVILNIAGDSIGTLNKIIGNLDDKDAVENDIKEEKELLFSDDDLDMPLTVGFVGNPNIGSVVLNTLSFNCDDFDTILGAQKDDGVFVVGSLFGGTGAAGFPLVINKFLESNDPNRPLLGGVALLPYFDIKEGDQTNGLIDTNKYDVHSDTFATKTRAALMYYDEYMNTMDYLYYAGDDMHPQYEHNVGGAKQENPSNLIEVMAALSALDFSKQQHPSGVVYKRPVWGFNDDDDATSNISGVRNAGLRRAMVKFQLLKELFENEKFLQDDIEQKRVHVNNISFSDTMRKAAIDEKQLKNCECAWGLYHLFKEWDIWTDELSNSTSNINGKRRFILFDNKQVVTSDNITSLFHSAEVKGIAKTKQVRTGTFLGMGGHTETVAVDPEIKEELAQAFNNLHLSGLVTDRVPSYSYLMLIISKALDKVLDNKCNI